MNVLAFDTCFGAVSVAVRWQNADGEWLQREAYEEMDIGQAERLMPMIATVMQEAGLTFSDLDQIAVTRGPGSFTGVRVGVAAARGLALATGLPVVSATSLRVMAARADRVLGERRQPVVAVAVDARRGSLYVQLFLAGTCEELSSAEVLSPAQAANKVTGHDAIAVGSGAVALVEAVAAVGPGRVEARLTTLQPHAANLAQLASGLTSTAPVVPLYLRLADAKPQTDAALPRAD
jgi:tRNA threonylcarbamoyladenosine biosynthesis protein TsaB